MKSSALKPVETLLGSEVLIESERGDALRKRLKGRRIGLLAHPASLDKALRPVWNRLREISISLDVLFGPQHGFVGDKQDNMVESDDFRHEELGIPVHSLYGETRRLKQEWLEEFDVLLVDVQDVGVRVYTFLTTLGYLLEDLSDNQDKELWVLDRPNPLGRGVEGHLLRPGRESFVGVAELPMRHGLTLGEFAIWYKSRKQLDTRLEVVPLEAWSPEDFWPRERPWIQPSPNMPGLYTVRCYPGTVVLEGTTISEARGTTRPLSMLGHPELDVQGINAWLNLNAPEVISGFALRPTVFEPTFHKHAGEACRGFELVAEKPFFQDELFRPYRLAACLLKAIKENHPGLPLWTQPPYEYELRRLPVDVITGGEGFRRWVENPEAEYAELDEEIRKDECLWQEEIQPYLLYHQREPEE